MRDFDPPARRSPAGRLDPKLGRPESGRLARSLYSAGRYREAVHQGEIVRDALGEDLERGFTGGDAMNQTVSSRVWLCFMLSELGRCVAE